MAERTLRYAPLVKMRCGLAAGHKRSIHCGTSRKPIFVIELCEAAFERVR